MSAAAPVKKKPSGGCFSGICRALTRARVTVSEFCHLVNLPQEDFDGYFDSHETVMGQEHITCKADEEKVVAWYKVVNHFCAIGACEKMYIPPCIDPKVGNVANQALFEKQMADTLGAAPGKQILDMGSGKGRIAHEVACHSGAKVTGINYDRSQVDDAILFAKEEGMLDKQLEFHYGTFNDPLPFEDASFDGAYEIGAFCYVIDKVKVFKEIHRILKPGARFSYCDWVRINYDEKDPHHVELIKAVKPLTGMVEMPAAKEMEDAFKAAGFEVEFSGEASTDGKQLGNLLADVDKSFWFFQGIINGLCKVRLIPKNLKKLWFRMRDGGEALKEVVEKDLLTMSYQIVVRKPDKQKTQSTSWFGLGCVPAAVPSVVQGGEKAEE